LQVGGGTPKTIEVKEGASAEAVKKAIEQAGIEGLTVTVDAGKVVLTTSMNPSGVNTDANITITAEGASTAADEIFGTTLTATGTKAADAEKSVGQIDVSSAPGAQEAIQIIDGAIQAIDSQRADLGAVQNRFDNTISNLQNISENVSAARGRIQDTDFAAETANLSKNQILQQAGTAILAQAKQLPQAVLSLLQ